MGVGLVLSSLPFLCLIIIPENWANHKRYFQHAGNGAEGFTNNNGGLNFTLDSNWNGTFVTIPGGSSSHHHPSLSTSSLLTSTTTLGVGGSGNGVGGGAGVKQHQQLSPLNIDIRMGFMIGSARKPGDEEYSRPGLTIAGGLTYALYTLQHSKFFGDLSHPVNINFLLTVAETFGDEDRSLWQVAQLWKQHNVSVIIGPQETCLHEARLASSLNIPMISYFCSDEATSDKRHFPTFSRSRPPDAAISRAVASLVLSYGWCDSLTVIYSDSSDDQRFKRVAKSLSLLFREKGVSTHPEISYRGPYHHGYGDNPFDGIVAQTKETTRIYIIISEYFEHLGLVLALKKHNLLESGEYLVIGVSMDDFKEDTWNPRRYFRGLLTDENETEAPSAFRSYLGIVASAPKNFTEFSRRVNHFMEMEPFRFQNPLLKFGAYKNIRIEAAYLYDAVMLYAHVIRDILQEYFWSVFSTVSPEMSLSNNGDIPNSNNNEDIKPNKRRDEQVQGQQQTSRQSQRLIPPGRAPKLAIRHRRDHVSVLSNEKRNYPNNSQTGTTSTSFVSGNGNTKAVFDTLVVDEERILAKIRDGREVSRRMRNIRYNSATGHETKMDENGDAEGNFTLVALKSKNGEFGLYPVGFFMRSTAQLPELTLTDTIDWVAEAPPVSQPECGFHGEKCESETFSMWAVGTACLSLAFLISALYLVFRHWRLSRDMDTLLWRIDKKDIEWETGHLFPVVRGDRARLLGCSGMSSGSQASLAKFSSRFAPLVSYRERIFAAKALNVCHMDAGLKHQLKMLREIRHENLNSFIGACVFDEGLLLIYEYCSRGSIKDILENGDLKLDDMFVSSLVGDLLRGLSYLHDSSQFRYHGNLKPTNCLIDSRWNLKLSDFGLKPYEYKLRRTTDLIVPPTCNLVTTTGGIATNRVSTPGNGVDDNNIESIAKTTSGAGVGGVAFYQNNTHSAAAGSGYGGRSQSFGSSFHGQVLSQVTSPYLSPEYPLLIKSREDAIFLHNQPGFCFRRNGKPRYLSSLHESKSRKIVPYMDGKEGLRPNPALNVVSDTPTLGEILSSPEIVQILCELRNTAALMTNEQLFQVFADQLGKTHRKFRFFKEFQGPLDYLMQYRRNLIQEFFDTLKTEAEMRLFVLPVDPTAALFQLSGVSPLSSAGNKSSSASKDEANSNFTSRASTNKEENDSPKSYEPDLATRMVNKVKSYSKPPQFGGPVPPPPPPPLQRTSTTLKELPNTIERNNNEKESKRNNKNGAIMEQDVSSVKDSGSKQDIFDTSDFIPTSGGYMTVEDWNVAVLEQLSKAQNEEEKKKEAKKKSHNKKSAPSSSSAENNEQDDHHHEQKDNNLEKEHQDQQQQIATDLKDNSNNNNNSNKEQDVFTNKEDGDNATEELRKKVAAVAAAEEEAKYRLDQKIMGLAGITSLYKSNNIGFAKYFEHKDEMQEKELKRRENPNNNNNSNKKKKRASSSSDGSGWLAPVHHNFSKGNNNASSKNVGGGGGDSKKIFATNIQSSTNTLTDASSVGTKDAASVASSNKRRIVMSKKSMKRALSSSRTKSYQRQEFDTFVKGLINNIEEISAVGKQVSGLSKRRPVALQRLIHPLVRLLRRDSLFQTLNDEDIFFSEFEGGKKELERIVAEQLPTANIRQKGHGFTFKLPSRTSMQVTMVAADGDSSSDVKSPLNDSSGSDEIMYYPNQYYYKSNSASSSSPPYSARSSNKPPSSAASAGTTGYRHNHRYVNNTNSELAGRSQVDTKETCSICPPRSLQRVCCAACRAKTQQACSSVLRRDKNCKVTLSMNSWKIPGMQASNWKRKEHLAEAAQMMNPYARKMASKIPAKLRKAQIQKSCVEGLRRGDIYSLGIILWELIRRESLSSYLGIKDDKQIRERICHGIAIPFQPSAKMGTVTVEVEVDELFWSTTLQSFELPFGEKQQLNSSKNFGGGGVQSQPTNNSNGINHFDQIRECLKDCLSCEPETRPDIKAVRMRLRPLHKGMRSNIFDIMIGLMEKYANNLEILVDERTKQLSEEKRKTDSLLYELIPASVAEELKEGLRVPAQNYDCVSIYFSDIVGFTSMSSQSTPLQIVEFLNDLYTCFDSIIESFDVYKVETIGDAYMVASGLPGVRQGNSHAVEIANMALTLLQRVTNFQIRHRANDTLKLRIGIHSGPVCAGVVGLKRPRYCLFGDSVNVASRMESLGAPFRIHCSEAFANLIQNDPNPQFELEERGLIDVKGKGDMMTYWLIGKRASTKAQIIKKSDTNESCRVQE